MSDNHKLKAVEINIESLKLYITLSTVAVAGILTFYSSLNNAESKGLFCWSIILFILCGVLSVVIVNHFIIQANNDAYDVRTTLSRALNFIAIFLFVGGIFTGSMFIGKNINNKSKHIGNTNGQIIIENNKITIGENNKMKLIVIQDSLSSNKEIYINCEKK